MTPDKKNFPSAADFLPTSATEMKRRGWDELDFLCITGDAYVDHPSFGHAVVSRFLESKGYRVGVIPQPDWRSPAGFAVMGRPRLAVLVAAGNLDSMLSNYSSRTKRRREDAYSPGGEAGRRPDRATIVYCNRIRELWGDVPLVIGGIEASLRRAAHYDYWSDSVRRSILIDSRADLLIYGMAETQLEMIAALLASGKPVREIHEVPGTCWKTHDRADAPDVTELPSYDAVSSDRRVYADAFKSYYLEQNFVSGRQLIQDQGPWLSIHNPPPPPMNTEALDAIYSLPYARRPHPMYEGHEIPALAEVRFSITSHRGCFGECAFCAISSHQGRVIGRRSAESIVNEARLMTRDPDFKGYIHDVGGPTANFRTRSCARSETMGACRGRSCLFPKPCRELEPSHREYLEILRRVRELPGVKKVFVRSGLRYDYIMADPDGMDFLDELCRHHVSGQLKIAPEHASEKVLSRMRKSSGGATEKFIRAYRETNDRIEKKQFLVPYFMSSHPGCGLREAVELAEFIRDMGVRPEQVQEFTPTPGTVSTCMYYSGIDPMTGEDVYVPRDTDERAMQRALLQYWMPRNRELVLRALEKAGRADLIGRSRKCLITK
ncbi:MAG: YgiQ family radical SAM protein [Synergistaceae bacterium]|jgi:uncharacterized radical SAM protein YgiQ|nr:YgiQ family radical SAM protein [Synergistaceae bacterium]